MTLGDAQVINANWNDAALEGRASRAPARADVRRHQARDHLGLVADDADRARARLYNGSNNLLIGYWDLGATMPLRSDATIWFRQGRPVHGLPAAVRRGAQAAEPRASSLSKQFEEGSIT